MSKIKEGYTESLTVSEVWRLIAKSAGASDAQAENLVQIMKDADKKPKKENTEPEDNKKMTGEEEDNDDKDEDDNKEKYLKEESITELEGLLDCLVDFETSGQGLECTLDALASSMKLLAQHLLTKELYQIKNTKGAQND
jgi:hypothetical protein